MTDMRSLNVVAGAALLLFGLAGCGQTPAEDGPAPQPSEEVASAKSGPAAEKPEANKADAEQAVRSFVDGLFAGYEGKGDLNNYFDDPGATFEPEMAARMAKLYADASDTGMYHDTFEADPVCACQDFDKFSHTIGTVEVTGDRAKVTLSTANFGETQSRTLQLVETAAGWRIYDIDASYRALVFAD